MSAPEFAIRYPLFALRAAPRKYVSCDLSEAQPKGKGRGILIFTSVEKATKFLNSTGWEAEVIRFERESVFRMFVLAYQNTVGTLVFDAEVEHRGVLRSRESLRVPQRYPIALVLERYLQGPGYAWDYPIYALRTLQGAYACGHVGLDPERMTFLVVYTDWDLADRGVMVRPTAHTSIPIEDGVAFARLVRELPPGIAGVVFDPPELTDGELARIVVLLRDDLLACLEAEL